MTGKNIHPASICDNGAHTDDMHFDFRFSVTHFRFYLLSIAVRMLLYVKPGCALSHPLDHRLLTEDPEKFSNVKHHF